MRRLATALAALALAVGLCVSPAHAIIYFPWTPPGATPQISRDGVNYNSALDTALQMSGGHAIAYLRAWQPDDIDKACDCSQYPHDNVNAFRWTIIRWSDNHTIATLDGANQTYDFTQYGDFWVKLAVNDAGLYADDPGGYLEQTPALAVHVMGLEIIAAHDYIVPGSEGNAVKYHIYPDTYSRDEATGKFEVRDASNVLRRTINWGGPRQGISGGEHGLQWNGKRGDGQPLTESGAPYSYTLIIDTDLGGDLTASIGNRNLIEWICYIVLSDTKGPDDTWESGIDESTVADPLPLGQPTGYGVSVQVSGSSDVPVPYYYVEADTPNPEDAEVSLRTGGTGASFMLFYTTPTNTDLDTIRYTMHINASGLSDMTMAEWDLDERTDQRETQGTWAFGIDSSGEVVDWSESYQ